MTSAPKVCYTGPFLDCSGYGEATRNAIGALHRAGADIKTEKARFTTNSTNISEGAKLSEELATREVDYKIKILHVTPDLYPNYMQSGKYHIGHLFWETSLLPKSWTAYCNRVQEIWTGTPRNEEILRSSGVNVPIKVYPQAIDTSVEPQKPFYLEGTDENTLIFYSIFEWNERKNPRALITAYLTEFNKSDNVLLLLKCHIGDYTKEGAQKVVNEIRSIRDGLGRTSYAPIQVNTNLLTDDEKHRFHDSGHVYVTTTRGEGWNIPLVEAALHKKHIISPRLGGAVEFFKKAFFKEIPHEMVPISQVFNKYYEPGQKWGQVDITELRNLMREAHTIKNGKFKFQLSIRGAKAKEFVKKYFNMNDVGSLMVHRLQEIEESL